MRCPSCGFENPEGLKFCNACGTPLLGWCAQCGFANQPQAKFCGDCGAALAPPARASTAPPLAPRPHPPLTYTPGYLAENILTSKAAFEGERKQVTVLFADLKDSTRLIEGLDPEAAQQLLDPAIHLMMDAVHRYEGTVNKVVGDGIMALFGAPIAHEDHAVRACYAALGMQAALRRHSDEVRRTHGLAVDFRVGLNSGEVVMRAIDHALHIDYSAIGQTVHLAARMEQLATPGHILLTPATLRLVEGLVQVIALGAIPVKGLTAPVEVFELVGASAVHRRLQAGVAHGLTRFVGRETESTALAQALARAGTGHGQVVAMVGEAGVGKSRLLYEFMRSPPTQGWRVLEAAAVSYGKTTPYFPVVDLLKRYSHLDERDDSRTVRAKVSGQVLTLDEALQDTLPALLALLDVLPEDSPFRTLDPPQRRQRTLEALTRVLLRESQAQPLLLVFEDLHWIDSETQAWLDRLVEGLPTAHLLLLINYRHEYQHGWGSKTYYTQLRLDPLPPTSADEVLQALMGEDSSLAPLKPLLITRTEGNPFFLEESVHTLAETGVLIGTPGAYHLGTPINRLQVPATVQAVLAARIDRLPPEEKRLLQTAAVIGTEVALPLLQTIADLPKAVLHRGLAHLQAAEFLYETRLFPEIAYTFKHALTHEVAYSNLLQERRRGLHGRIVEALEVLVGERVAAQVERLAHHALRGEMWGKAVMYCQQAGARAHDRAAFREAVVFFEQALQALAHLSDQSDTRGLGLELRLAVDHPLGVLGEHGRRRALLSEAEALAKALEDRPRLGRVLARMAQGRRLAGDPEGAITAGRQALVLAAEFGDSVLQVQASHHLGQAYHAIGDFGRAAELLRRNVETADEKTGAPSTDVLIQSRSWLARTLSVLGTFAEGGRLGEEALHLAALGGRGDTPIIAHTSLGYLYLAQGDLEHAIRVYEQGLALCRASGHRTDLRPIAAGLGFAYALQGRLTEGRILLQEAVSEDIHSGGLHGHAHRLAWLSEVCRLSGHADEATHDARQALDLARQQRARGDEAHALHQLGTVHAHADPPDVEQAEAYYRQALALADELSMRPLQAHCHRGLGTLYATIRRRDEARAELSTAIDFYRSMDMTFWLPQAEAALAQAEAR